MSVPRRYGLLRAIAFVLKLLAWLVLLAGVLGAAVALLAVFGSGSGLAGIPQYLRLAGAIISLVLGIIWFVQLYAFSSILSLLVNIEETTRLLAAYAAAPEPTILPEPARPEPAPQA